MLVKTIAEVLDLSFSRIQFTPDLMPGDITGTEILEEDAYTKKRSFRFIKGPLFSNILLADEINRTPPKTQSALLEAMQEHRVTSAGTTFELSEPFFVLATENPIEQEGTYPLPEAQLDRFMFNLWLDYPSEEEEYRIIESTTGGLSERLEKIISKDELLEYQRLLRLVPVGRHIIEYAVKFVASSRATDSRLPKEVKDLISWGAGPRATQYLVLAAKARAIMDGRFTPTMEDLQKSIIPVLRHRIIPSFSAESEGIGSVEIIQKLMEING